MAKRKLNKAQLKKILVEDDENLGVETDQDSGDDASDSEVEKISEASDLEDEISCESDTDYIPVTNRKIVIRKRNVVARNVSVKERQVSNRKITYKTVKKVPLKKRRVPIKKSEIQDFVGKDGCKWEKQPVAGSENNHHIDDCDKIHIPDDYEALNPIVKRQAPQYLTKKIRFNYENANTILRSSCNIKLTNAVKATSQNALFFKGVKMFNSLPKIISDENSFYKFKKLLRGHLVESRTNS